MRRRALAVALGLALLVALLIRSAGPGVARSRQAPAPEARPSDPPVSAAPDLPPAPSRDLFRYAAPEAGVRLPAAQPSSLASLPEPPPPPVRLVGLVSKSGRIAVALSISGEVLVLGIDGEAKGYKILSIDEDNGVRLRGPDGAEFFLSLPPS